MMETPLHRYARERMMEKKTEKKYEEELSSLKTKLEEVTNSLIKERADFQNYIKRREREISSKVFTSLSSFFLDLLPILDNLRRAVEFASEEEKKSPVFKGVQLTVDQIEHLLKKYEVEPIEPKVGEKFDPVTSQVLKTVEDSEREDETVVEVVQRGYSFKGKVIKPALVVVVKNRKEEQ